MARLILIVVAVLVFGLPVFNLFRLLVIRISSLTRYKRFIQKDITGIVVHCHWLTKDGKPGLDYKSRLDAAVKLYQELASLHILRIILTGGIHFEDKISLASAGKIYLIECGIPSKDIISTPETRTAEIQAPSYSAYDTSEEVAISLHLASPFSPRYSNFAIVVTRRQAFRAKLLWWFRGCFGFNIISTEAPNDPFTGSFKYRVIEFFSTIYTFYDPYWRSPLVQHVRRGRMPKY